MRIILNKVRMNVDIDPHKLNQVIAEAKMFMNPRETTVEKKIEAKERLLRVIESVLSGKQPKSPYQDREEYSKTQLLKRYPPLPPEAKRAKTRKR